MAKQGNQGQFPWPCPWPGPWAGWPSPPGGSAATVAAAILGVPNNAPATAGAAEPEVSEEDWGSYTWLGGRWCWGLGQVGLFAV